jgi:hypothetical protein
VSGNKHTLELLRRAWERDIVQRAAEDGTPLKASVLAGDHGDEGIFVITITGPWSSLDEIAKRELGADDPPTT